MKKWEGRLVAVMVLGIVVLIGLTLVRIGAL